ncbi:unnamed protein product [Amoebophrya sp. A25]|nr:unnamed protein product [Amoebophrya sp. A25]|eukprot:GSA25T00023600001.1
MVYRRRYLRVISAARVLQRILPPIIRSRRQQREDAAAKILSKGWRRSRVASLARRECVEYRRLRGKACIIQRFYRTRFLRHRAAKKIQKIVVEKLVIPARRRQAACLLSTSFQLLLQEIYARKLAFSIVDRAIASWKDQNGKKMTRLARKEPGGGSSSSSSSTAGSCSSGKNKRVAKAVIGLEGNSGSAREDEVTATFTDSDLLRFLQGAIVRVRGDEQTNKHSQRQQVYTHEAVAVTHLPITICGPPPEAATDPRRLLEYLVEIKDQLLSSDKGTSEEDTRTSAGGPTDTAARHIDSSPSANAEGETEEDIQIDSAPDEDTSIMVAEIIRDNCHRKTKSHDKQQRIRKKAKIGFVDPTIHRNKIVLASSIMSGATANEIREVNNGTKSFRLRMASVAELMSPLSDVEDSDVNMHSKTIAATPTPGRKTNVKAFASKSNYPLVLAGKPRTCLCLKEPTQKVKRRMKTLRSRRQIVWETLFGSAAWIPSASVSLQQTGARATGAANFSGRRSVFIFFLDKAWTRADALDSLLLLLALRFLFPTRIVVLQLPHPIIRIAASECEGQEGSHDQTLGRGDDCEGGFFSKEDRTGPKLCCVAWPRPGDAHHAGSASSDRSPSLHRVSDWQRLSLNLDDHDFKSESCSPASRKKAMNCTSEAICSPNWLATEVPSPTHNEAVAEAAELAREVIKNIEAMTLKADIEAMTPQVELECGGGTTTISTDHNISASEDRSIIHSMRSTTVFQKMNELCAWCPVGVVAAYRIGIATCNLAVTEKDTMKEDNAGDTAASTRSAANKRLAVFGCGHWHTGVGMEKGQAKEGGEMLAHDESGRLMLTSIPLYNMPAENVRNCHYPIGAILPTFTFGS